MMTGRKLIKLIEQYGLMDKRLVEDSYELVFEGEHHECNSVADPNVMLEYDTETVLCLQSGLAYDRFV